MLAAKVADHIGGSARVLLRPSMTQRYKMDGRACRRHAEASDIVFDYSNVCEGNEIWGANQGATGGRRRATQGDTLG